MREDDNKELNGLRLELPLYSLIIILIIVIVLIRILNTNISSIKKENDKLRKENNDLKQEIIKKLKIKNGELEQQIIDYKWQIDQVPYVIDYWCKGE